MSDNDQLICNAPQFSAHYGDCRRQRCGQKQNLGVGPVVENGFYYDIDIPGVTISTDDFKKIEKQMYKVINQKQDFVRSEKSYRSRRWNGRIRLVSHIKLNY
ncbi:MAG: hypothetical protein V9F03_00400 [Microthrixaceae bacterium]